VKPRLDGTCFVFHYYTYRKRFKRLCLNSTPHDRAVAREQFKRGPPLLDGGRVWGVLVSVTEYFWSRREHIEPKWMTDRMLGGVAPEQDSDLDRAGDDADDGNCDYSAKIMSCAEGMVDPFWWSFVGLLYYFGVLLGRLEYWLQSCPCHPTSMRLHFNIKLRDLNCPMRGLRAACMAAGKLHGLIQVLIDEFHSLVVNDLRSPLTLDQKSSLLDQFHVGKQFVVMELHLRFNGWLRIPLRTMAIASEEESDVVECIVDSLAQLEALTLGQGLDQLTFDLLSRRSPVRAQLVAIAQGSAQWRDVPQAKRYRDIFLMLPTLEVSNERAHAQYSGSVRSAPNHSTQYGSVHGLRKLEIEEEFASEDTAKALVGKLALARNSRLCVQALGMQYHPDMLTYVDPKTGLLSTRLPLTIASDVIYRNDAWTQFKNLDLYPDIPPVPPDNPPDDFVPQHGVGPPHGDDGDNGDDGEDLETALDRCFGVLSEDAVNPSAGAPPTPPVPPVGDAMPPSDGDVTPPAPPPSQPRDNEAEARHGVPNQGRKFAACDQLLFIYFHGFRCWMVHLLRKYLTRNVQPSEI
jgi:hypothetical protein